MARRPAKPELVPPPSRALDVLTEWAESVVVAELKNMGYRVRITQIDSSETFSLGVRLCALDDKLALVSVVNSKEVRKRLGFPNHSCLILERDNYYFVPAWIGLDAIQSIIRSIKHAPGEVVCCVCTSPTGKYCWKCNKGTCRKCISPISTELQLLYVCPSCGTRNALEDLSKLS
jgi:hypothetical protein